MRLLYPLLALAACIAAPAATAADLERGRMLHENHCRMCHDSIAYKRGERIANDYALYLKGSGALRPRPMRWLSNLATRLLVWIAGPFVIAGFWWRSGECAVMPVEAG